MTIKFSRFDNVSSNGVENSTDMILCQDHGNTFVLPGIPWPNRTEALRRCPHFNRNCNFDCHYMQPCGVFKIDNKEEISEEYSVCFKDYIDARNSGK